MVDSFEDYLSSAAAKQTAEDAHGAVIRQRVLELAQPAISAITQCAAALRDRGAETVELADERHRIAPVLVRKPRLFSSAAWDVEQTSEIVAQKAAWLIGEDDEIAIDLDGGLWMQWTSTVIFPSRRHTSEPGADLDDGAFDAALTRLGPLTGYQRFDLEAEAEIAARGAVKRNSHSTWPLLTVSASEPLKASSQGARLEWRYHYGLDKAELVYRYRHYTDQELISHLYAATKARISG